MFTPCTKKRASSTSAFDDTDLQRVSEKADHFFQVYYRIWNSTRPCRNNWTRSGRLLRIPCVRVGLVLIAHSIFLALPCFTRLERVVWETWCRSPSFYDVSIIYRLTLTKRWICVWRVLSDRENRFFRLACTADKKYTTVPGFLDSFTVRPSLCLCCDDFAQGPTSEMNRENMLEEMWSLCENHHQMRSSQEYTCCRLRWAYWHADGYNGDGYHPKHLEGSRGARVRRKQNVSASFRY